MTTIRPNLPPPLPSNVAPKPADTMRQAAQRAFFEIAAGRAPAAPAAVQASAPSPPTRAAAPLTPLREAPAEAAARPLRPGSLLDIRV